MINRLFCFVGGQAGAWRVLSAATIAGEPLAGAERLDIVGGTAAPVRGASWLLRGITSNERYVTRAEKNDLSRNQPALGRPDATHAALIPIRKNAAWWALPQDERRRIFEEQSAHIGTGLRYLPAIARRLHHCRDLGGEEPFDFLTWFEFAPAHTALFDLLLRELRASPEWAYVDREIDIRVVREK
jgi:hypothetical protein